MTHDILTPAQTHILELLCAFDCLTTRQIHEYLGATTTKRATEYKLRSLEELGFVRGARLEPGRGAVSERCWRLVMSGGDPIEASSEKTEEEATRSMYPDHTAVLRLLAEMKQLSTTQIWEHLHSNKSKRYTRLLLYRLRRRGYVSSRPLYPERGATSEHYWLLSNCGAQAIGVRYELRYRRRPIRESIEHRGVLLELSRQVQAAGWSLISPVPAGAFQTFSDTPQRRLLVEAVLRSEQLALDALLKQGYPSARLKERIDRHEAGHVGAVVPRAVNDYVAFIPGQPEQTVLLIPHPPLAGRGFWIRKPGQRAENRVRYSRSEARTQKYARLAQMVPVIAVFGQEEVGRQYAQLLQTAGFEWVTAHKIGERLRSLRQPSGYG